MPPLCPARRFPLCAHSLVESLRGSNPALESAILASLGSCVTSTDLGLPGKRVVRAPSRAASAAAALGAFGR
jgi:hypothetical protein